MTGLDEYDLIATIQADPEVYAQTGSSVLVGRPGLQPPWRSAGLFIAEDDLGVLSLITNGGRTTVEYVTEVEPLPNSEVFDLFMGLDVGSEVSVFRFAQAHGTLDRCGCNARGVVDKFHEPHQSAVAEQLSSLPGDYQVHVTAERLQSWRITQRAFRAVLDMSASLREGRAIEPDALRTFALWHQADEESGSSDADRYNREQLDRAINNLIREAQIVPAFVTTDDEAQINFEGPTLFARLVVELVQRAMRIERLRTCIECGKPFPHGRRRKYCADCGAKAARRDASRRYRSRMRANSRDSVPHS